MDRIIYDGLIRGHRIRFGSGFCRGIKDSYEKARHAFGLITQLPENGIIKSEKSDVEKLRFYMKNKSNRDNYWDEIVKISSKTKSLKDLFYQEMGRANASHFSKQLKRVGLEKNGSASLTI